MTWELSLIAIGDEVGVIPPPDLLTALNAGLDDIVLFDELDNGFLLRRATNEDLRQIAAAAAQEGDGPPA